MSNFHPLEVYRDPQHWIDLLNYDTIIMSILNQAAHDCRPNLHISKLLIQG